MQAKRSGGFGVYAERREADGGGERRLRVGPHSAWWMSQSSSGRPLVSRRKSSITRTLTAVNATAYQRPA